MPCIARTAVSGSIRAREHDHEESDTRVPAGTQPERAAPRQAGHGALRAGGHAHPRADPLRRAAERSLRQPGPGVRHHAAQPARALEHEREPGAGPELCRGFGAGEPGHVLSRGLLQQPRAIGLPQGCHGRHLDRGVVQVQPVGTGLGHRRLRQPDLHAEIRDRLQRGRRFQRQRVSVRQQSEPGLLRHGDLQGHVDGEALQLQQLDRCHQCRSGHRRHAGGGRDQGQRAGQHREQPERGRRALRGARRQLLVHRRHSVLFHRPARPLPGVL